jgi:hypothetical protein
MSPAPEQYAFTGRESLVIVSEGQILRLRLSSNPTTFAVMVQMKSAISLLQSTKDWITPYVSEDW